MIPSMRNRGVFVRVSMKESKKRENKKVFVKQSEMSNSGSSE